MLARIPALDEAKKKLSASVARHKLRDESVRVRVEPLLAKEVIGTPGRQDFALLEGKEVMIEAQFRGSFGQAFTNQPRFFEGKLGDVLDLNLETASNRAIFISTLNAIAANLGMATGTRHCRDDEPERCAAQIADSFMKRFGVIKIGLVGYQPAILENLVQSFGVDNIRCSDLNPKNIGRNKFGSKIWDGKTEHIELINWCDLLLVTSSTVVNNTFDDIYYASVSRKKHLSVFGVTGAGVCALLGLERICFYGH